MGSMVALLSGTLPFSAVTLCGQAAVTAPAGQALSFAPPAGWVKDADAAKKLSLYAAYVPNGTKVETADSAITISFDKKDPNTPGLDNLKNYFADDMRQTLAQAPGAQFERWQPSKLDATRVHYMSIEIYGKQRNQPAPQHLVIIDAGDGFYSVVVTARTRDSLKATVFDDFFNSLTLSPRP